MKTSSRNFKETSRKMATGSQKGKAAAVSRDEATTKLLLSARGYKGHLTRQLNAVDRSLTAFARSPSEITAQEILDAVKQAKRTMANLQDKMQELMETASSTEDFEVHEMDLDSYFERFSRTKEVAMDAIVASKFKVQRHLNPASPSQASNAGAGDAGDANSAIAPASGRAHARANLALRPEELSPEHTPQEMRVWISQFRSYYSTSGFAACALEDQHAYFLQCLNPTLRFRVERHVEARTPVFGDAPSCCLLYTSDAADE